MGHALSEGQLVQIISKNRHFTEEGFSVTSSCETHQLILFEEIDLGSYPGYNDFHGKPMVVEDGEVATILRYMGRPLQISGGDKWVSYDIYEILINNHVYQVFGHNLAVPPVT
jgi:hypothetical protein